MGHEITPRMEQIYEWRTQQRMTFEQIGRALGISRQAAHESYMRAANHVQRYLKELELPEGTSFAEIDRAAEIEYLDNMLRRYMSIADNTEEKKPRTAIEALNGAHKYYETLIKLKGMQTPIKVEHRVITNEDLEAELLKVTAEILELEGVVDAEVVGVED